MNDKKGLDFKHKEVINITDGKRLGFVLVVTADFKTGTIREIIVPGNTKIFNLFSSKESLVIPWRAIKTIGEDLDLSGFEAFGEVIKYPFSTPSS